MQWTGLGLVTVKAGVEDIIVNGRLRVRFKPLVEKLPVIGALQFSFIEVPKINFELRVFGEPMDVLASIYA